MTQGVKGDKEILISKISSIQLKQASFFTNGFIQFSLSGSNDSKGGILDATKDENSVMFKSSQQAEFVGLKEKLQYLMSSENSSTSSLDELEKLANLLQKGIITQDEFDAKKKSILAI